MSLLKRLTRKTVPADDLSEQARQQWQQRVAAEQLRIAQQIQQAGGTPATPVAPAPQPTPAGPVAPAKHPAKPAAPTRSVREVVLGGDAPIKRETVDALYPYIRVVVGILFVGFCGYSTAFWFGWDIKGATTLPDGTQATVDVAGVMVQWRYIIGAAFALAIFIAEILLAERSPWGYRMVLAVDTFYTWRQVNPWLTGIADDHWPAGAEGRSMLGMGLIIVIAIVIGWLLAKYGEIFLLGKRRKGLIPLH